MGYKGHLKVNMEMIHKEKDKLGAFPLTSLEGIHFVSQQSLTVLVVFCSSIRCGQSLLLFSGLRSFYANS